MIGPMVDEPCPKRFSPQPVDPVLITPILNNKTGVSNKITRLYQCCRGLENWSTARSFIPFVLTYYYKKKKNGKQHITCLIQIRSRISFLKGIAKLTEQPLTWVQTRGWFNNTQKITVAPRYSGCPKKNRWISSGIEILPEQKTKHPMN